MKTFEYTITDILGLHARPAGMFVQEVRKYKSRITLEANGRSTDGRKLMMIMGLGVKQGDTVLVSAEGVDEEEAIAAMEHFFRENL